MDGTISNIAALLAVQRVTALLDAFARQDDAIVAAAVPNHVLGRYEPYVLDNAADDLHGLLHFAGFGPWLADIESGEGDAPEDTDSEPPSPPPA